MSSPMPSEITAMTLYYTFKSEMACKILSQPPISEVDGDERPTEINIKQLSLPQPPEIFSDSIHTLSVIQTQTMNSETSGLCSQSYQTLCEDQTCEMRVKPTGISSPRSRAMKRSLSKKVRGHKTMTTGTTLIAPLLTTVYIVSYLPHLCIQVMKLDNNMDDRQGPVVLYNIIIRYNVTHWSCSRVPTTL
ncbi:hypothetical protein Btru_077979 [Bulinus truncatus]|nr:hypothetical protein Btru_077979 [Bulinus truncatus]